MTDPLMQTTTSFSFDPAAYRLDQNFHEMSGVEKLITHIRVRKPNKIEFVRTHKDEQFRQALGLLDIDGQYYLLSPSLHAELNSEMLPVVLFTAINREGELFLWPVRLSSPDFQNAWNESALQAAIKAGDTWLKIKSNKSLGAYEAVFALGDLDEPIWPDLTFSEIVGKAFNGRVIDSADHLVLRKLRGEI